MHRRCLLSSCVSLQTASLFCGLGNSLPCHRQLSSCAPSATQQRHVYQGESTGTGFRRDSFSKQHSRGGGGGGGGGNYASHRPSSQRRDQPKGYRDRRYPDDENRSRDSHRFHSSAGGSQQRDPNQGTRRTTTTSASHMARDQPGRQSSETLGRVLLNKRMAGVFPVTLQSAITTVDELLASGRQVAATHKGEAAAIDVLCRELTAFFRSNTALTLPSVAKEQKPIGQEKSSPSASAAAPRRLLANLTHIHNVLIPWMVGLSSEGSGTSLVHAKVLWQVVHWAEDELTVVLEHRYTTKHRPPGSTNSVDEINKSGGVAKNGNREEAELKDVEALLGTISLLLKLDRLLTGSRLTLPSPSEYGELLARNRELQYVVLHSLLEDYLRPAAASPAPITTTSGTNAPSLLEKLLHSSLIGLGLSNRSPEAHGFPVFHSHLAELLDCCHGVVSQQQQESAAKVVEKHGKTPPSPGQGTGMDAEEALEEEDVLGGPGLHEDSMDALLSQTLGADSTGTSIQETEFTGGHVAGSSSPCPCCTAALKLFEFVLLYCGGLLDRTLEKLHSARTPSAEHSMVLGSLWIVAPYLSSALLTSKLGYARSDSGQLLDTFSARLSKIGGHGRTGAVGATNSVDFVLFSGNAQSKDVQSTPLKLAEAWNVPEKQQTLLCIARFYVAEGFGLCFESQTGVRNSSGQELGAVCARLAVLLGCLSAVMDSLLRKEGGKGRQQFFVQAIYDLLEDVSSMVLLWELLAEKQLFDLQSGAATSSGGGTDTEFVALGKMESWYLLLSELGRLGLRSERALALSATAATPTAPTRAQQGGRRLDLQRWFVLLISAIASPVSLPPDSSSSTSYADGLYAPLRSFLLHELIPHLTQELDPSLFGVDRSYRFLDNLILLPAKTHRGDDKNTKAVRYNFQHPSRPVRLFFETRLQTEGTAGLSALAQRRRRLLGLASQKQRDSCVSLPALIVGCLYESSPAGNQQQGAGVIGSKLPVYHHFLAPFCLLQGGRYRALSFAPPSSHHGGGSTGSGTNQDGTKVGAKTFVDDVNCVRAAKLVSVLCREKIPKHICGGLWLKSHPLRVKLGLHYLYALHCIVHTQYKEKGPTGGHLFISPFVLQQVLSSQREPATTPGKDSLLVALTPTVQSAMLLLQSSLATATKFCLAHALRRMPSVSPSTPPQAHRQLLLDRLSQLQQRCGSSLPSSGDWITNLPHLLSPNAVHADVLQTSTVIPRLAIMLWQSMFTVHLEGNASAATGGQQYQVDYCTIEELCLLSDAVQWTLDGSQKQRRTAAQPLSVEQEERMLLYYIPLTLAFAGEILSVIADGAVTATATIDGTHDAEYTEIERVKALRDGVQEFKRRFLTDDRREWVQKALGALFWVEGSADSPHRVAGLCRKIVRLLGPLAEHADEAERLSGAGTPDGNTPLWKEFRDRVSVHQYHVSATVREDL